MEFRDVLTNIILMIGRAKKVIVGIGGNDSFVNIKEGKVQIQAIPNNETGKVLGVGLAGHEASHIAHTDPDAPIIRLVNLIEDIRIDRLDILEWPGMLNYTMGVERYFLEHNLYWNPEESPESALSAYILGKGRVEIGLDVLTPLRDKARAELVKVLGQDVFDGLDAILDKMQSLQATADVVALDQEIYDYLNQNCPPPPPMQGQSGQSGDPQEGQEGQSGGSEGQSSGEQDKPNDGDQQEGGQADGPQGDQQNQDGNPQQGENPKEAGNPRGNDVQGGQSGSQQGDQQGQDGSQQQGGQSGSQHGDQQGQDGSQQQGGQSGSQQGGSQNGSPQGGATGAKFDFDKLPKFDKGEALKEALGQAANAARKAGVELVSAIPVVKVAPGGYTEVSAAEARGVSNGVRQKLQHKLRARTRRKVHPRDSGQGVDCNHLHKMFVGDPNIFVTEKRKVSFSTYLHLLIDGSTSMAENSKAEIASASAMAISMALNQTDGIKTEITVFAQRINGDSAYSLGVIKPAGQQKVSACPIIASGGTPLGEAMDSATFLFSLRREKRKILIVLTDGEANRNSHVAEALRRYEKAGVEVYCIGIASNAGRNLFQNWQRIDEVRELPKALMGLVDSIV